MLTGESYGFTECDGGRAVAVVLEDGDGGSLMFDAGIGFRRVSTLADVVLLDDTPRAAAIAANSVPVVALQDAHVTAIPTDLCQLVHKYLCSLRC